MELRARGSCRHPFTLTPDDVGDRLVADLEPALAHELIYNRVTATINATMAEARAETAQPAFTALAAAASNNRPGLTTGGAKFQRLGASSSRPGDPP
jgi:hypothetical protein